MEIESLLTPKRVKIGLIALACAIVFFSSYFTVHQYERGVVTTWGKVSYVAAPGLSFKVPFVQSVTYYRTDIQNIQPQQAVNTYTVDNQEVDVIFNVLYRLPPDNIAFIYQNAQDYSERLFNIVVDRLKSEMGKINVAHVAEKRGELRDKIKAVLVTEVKVLGLEITDFQLTNIEYTKTFRAAVEAAASAKATVETREQEKQQAIRVAEKAKIVAEGNANAVREEAKGAADKGEAEAKAIRAQAEALQQNQKLVELRKAEKWDGALPQQMLSGVVPFMSFDATKLKQREQE